MVELRADDSVARRKCSRNGARQRHGHCRHIPAKTNAFWIGAEQSAEHATCAFKQCIAFVCCGEVSTGVGVDTTASEFGHRANCRVNHLRSCWAVKASPTPGQAGEAMLDINRR